MYFKLICSGLLVFVLTNNIIAQEETRFSVFIDPKLQWLQSDVPDVTFQSARVGFEGGLTIDRYFEKRYAFTSGISIGSEGGKLNYQHSTDFSVHGVTQNITNDDVTYKLQYITVPIGLKFKTNPIGYFSYFATLGLNTQFNINATVSSTNTNLDGASVSDNIHMLNLGYYFGLGAEYALGGGTSLLCGLIYRNGLLDITTQTYDKITTSSVSIRLGILF